MQRAVIVGVLVEHVPRFPSLGQHRVKVSAYYARCTFMLKYCYVPQWKKCYLPWHLCQGENWQYFCQPQLAWYEKESFLPACMTIAAAAAAMESWEKSRLRNLVKEAKKKEPTTWFTAPWWTQINGNLLAEKKELTAANPPIFSLSNHIFHTRNRKWLMFFGSSYFLLFFDFPPFSSSLCPFWLQGNC